MYLKFNLSNDNIQEWNLLKSANDAHVSIRDRYQELVDLCKEKGVAFKDIKAHMINRAKRVNLLTKNHYSEETGSMEYPSLAVCFDKKLAWAVALHNFLVWLKKSYKDYGVEIAKVTPKRKEKVVIRREKAVAPESTTVAPVAPVTQLEAEVSDFSDPSNFSNPVEPIAPVTVAGIIELLKANMSELEKLAASSDVHEQFMDCLEKMGIV